MFMNRKPSKYTSRGDDDGRLKPLSAVPAGNRVTVAELDAGRELWLRLQSMGIFPDAEAEVLTNYRRGPMLLVLGGSRIMLGRGMAEKIIVQVDREG